MEQLMTHLHPIQNIHELRVQLGLLDSFHHKHRRPFVTVTYAQSIDGSIATKDRRPLKISGLESMRLTHQLRACSDSILVGINTVLADDPKLTVRLVSGPNPQPVVLDTRLRIPANARLLQRTDPPVWLASTLSSDNRREVLTRNGAAVLPCEQNRRGQIDLRKLMDRLYERGIRSLMVEGGARVITNFIQDRLVDLFIITISPKLIGGLQVVAAPIVNSSSTLQSGTLHLADMHCQQLNGDLILWARPQWTNP
jgi:riboflavin-specific deaminase-like protein